MAIIFDEGEERWLDRRAEEIARQTGDPLPIARSAAIAELTRLRRQPKADVVELKRPEKR